MAHINWRRGDTPRSRSVRACPLHNDTPSSNHRLKKAASRRFRKRARFAGIRTKFDEDAAFPLYILDIKWNYW